jgi:N-acetylneuraminic acid mutarotase
MRAKIILRQLALVGLALAVASCGGSLLETPPGTLSILVSGFTTTAGDTTADISWTTNVPTTHLVEYGTSPGVYTQSTFQTDTAGVLHTVSLTGLTEAMTYHYRVRTFHSSLPDVTSAESSFATTASAPPTLAQKQRGVWIVGGLSGNVTTSAVSQVDLYDPVLDTWYASITSLPTAVSFAAACSWGGKLYVIGGFDTSGNVRNIVQIYDVAGDSWSSGAPMPPGAGLGRANVFAVTVNNRIYVLGGTTGNATAGWVLPAAGVRTWEYNPSGDSWTQKNDYTNATWTSERLLLAFNDVIYNLGGRSAAATPNTAHDGYAVTTNNYTNAVQEVLLTSARTGSSGVMYTPATGPAVMAIVGGFTALPAVTQNFIVQIAAGGTATSLFQYLYYPFTSPATWQPAAPPPPTYPDAVGFTSSALSGSKIYVFGGTNSVGTTTPPASGRIYVWSFDLAGLPNGSWTACPSMPVGRYGHTAVVVQ